MTANADTVVVETGATGVPVHSYVDWPAAIAGIVLAAAIALVMLTFGSAIGLSFANFHNGETVSPIWVGIAAATWLLWVEVSAMMCGGYLTGRLRRRAHDATEHESDVRDGAHGLIVWGGAVIIGALVATSGIGAAVSTLTHAAGGAASTVAAVAGPAAAGAAGNDSNAYFADALFRPVAGAPAPATAVAGNATAHADAVAEAGRILTTDAVAGSVPDADKTYLADLVARTTGMSADDAKKRIDDVLAQIDAAKQKAADAAEAARKTAVLAAFITAASLLVAAVGAYWAAVAGGNHRDKQVIFDSWFRRF